MNPSQIASMFEGLSDEYKTILCRDDKKLFESIIKGIGSDVTPSPQLIFQAFRETQWDKLRVVLLGQDPYPTGATGKAFDVGADGDISGSLKNISKAVESSGWKFNNGDLSSWSKQGVLLLNTALTTQPGITNAHTKIWKPWTRKIIEEIAKKKAAENSPLVFIFWGNPAAEYGKIIDRVNFASLNEGLPVHKYAVWGHPSPASTNNNGDPASNRKHFSNTDNFRKTNGWLVENGTTPIDWSTGVPDHTVVEETSKPHTVVEETSKPNTVVVESHDHTVVVES